MKTTIHLAAFLSLVCFGASLRAEDPGTNQVPEQAAHASEAFGDYAGALALRERMLAQAEAFFSEIESLEKTGACSRQDVRTAEINVEAQKTNVARLKRLIQDSQNKAEADAKWRGAMAAELDKPVTMDFKNAELDWTASAIQELTGVQILLDPNVGAQRVSLRVEAMPLKNVLNWICRQSRLRWDLRDRAVCLSRAGNAPVKAPGGERFEDGTRLRVKLPGGEEIDADATVLNRFPGLAEELLDRALDPAKDGFLAYRVAPQSPGLTLEDLASRVEALAPGAKLADGGKGIALITAEKSTDLAGIAARLRLHGIYRAHGPKPPENAGEAQADGALNMNQKCQVLSVKAEKNLVMISLGTEQGVKAGMPVRILRDGKVIGTGIVERAFLDMSSVKLAEGQQSVQAHDDVSFDAWPDVKISQPAAATSASKATVISVKAEQNLVMISAGTAQGTKIGMPVQIFRNGKVIGIGKVEGSFPDMSSVRLTEGQQIVQAHDEVSFELETKK